MGNGRAFITVVIVGAAGIAVLATIGAFASATDEDTYWEILGSVLMLISFAPAAWTFAAVGVFTARQEHQGLASTPAEEKAIEERVVVAAFSGLLTCLAALGTFRPGIGGGLAIAFAVPLLLVILAISGNRYGRTH